MIISYSNDFVFIRIPKCASTTCVVALYDMGFVNESEGDICTGVEGEDPDSKEKYGHNSNRKNINWPRFYGHRQEHRGRGRRTRRNRDRVKSVVHLPLLDQNLVSLVGAATDTRAHRQHIFHSPYKKLVDVGLIDGDMPCVSTIRHPVDRFVSITAYLSGSEHIAKRMYSDDPNECWDLYKNGYKAFGNYHDMFKVPQNYFVSEDAILFNVENTYDWLEKFAKERGYEYKKSPYFKNNKENQKIPLTEDRQKEIMDWFEDDFLLWEKSYREFN